MANSNAYLLAPPIDLTESAEGALLSFKHWYDLENNIDFGKVYIASEDSDYVFQELLTFTGTGGNWKTQYVDLREYAGRRCSSNSILRVIIHCKRLAGTLMISL